MKLLYTMAGAGIVAGGLHASGILEGGQVYPKPIEQVRGELSAMPIPPTVQRVTSGADLDVRRYPQSIEWHFRRAGRDVYLFTAALSATDPRHTRVKIDFAVGDGADAGSRTLIDTPYIRNTARLALTEQIAAELEDRSFDERRLGLALAARASAHPEELRGFGDSVRQMMVETADVVRGNSAGGDDRAPSHYRQQIESRRSMDEATRPMTRLPSN